MTDGPNDFHTFYRATGDSREPLGWQVLRDGVAVDLTSLTPTWKLTNNAGTVVIAETAAGIAIDDAENGLLSIDLPAEAVAEALIPTGEYSVELWLWVYLTDANEERETIPHDGRKRKLKLSRSV